MGRLFQKVRVIQTFWVDIKESSVSPFSFDKRGPCTDAPRGGGGVCGEVSGVTRGHGASESQKKSASRIKAMARHERRPAGARS